MKVAIFGDRRSFLPASWTKETIIGIAAEADLDSSKGAGAGASLTFIGVGGDLTLRVPPGSRITETGISFLGDRDIGVTPGDGPEIRVAVYGLLTDVKITH